MSLILGAIILHKVLKKIQTISARRAYVLLDCFIDAETEAQVCQGMAFGSHCPVSCARTGFQFSRAFLPCSDFYCHCTLQTEAAVPAPLSSGESRAGKFSGA